MIIESISLLPSTLPTLITVFTFTQLNIQYSYKGYSFCNLKSFFKDKTEFYTTICLVIALRLWKWCSADQVTQAILVIMFDFSSSAYSPGQTSCIVHTCKEHISWL